MIYLFNVLGINEGGMVNGVLSRKVEITLNSAVSLVQTVQPLLFIPCYKYVVGLAKRSFLILNRWCGWNRIPAPTSPTIAYNTKAGAVLLRLLTVKRSFNGGTFKLNDMKQMTAVEWLAKEICYISIDGKYIVDNAEDVTHIVEQAKAMEKDQHQETFKQSRQAKIFEQDMPPVWKSFEQYYNETFKSE